MNKVDALQSLRPGAEWVLRGDELEWLDTNQTQPTEAEIAAEVHAYKLSMTPKHTPVVVQQSTPPLVTN